MLGSLVEKELTTPDYYPLTLNALVTACNQKTSREPVVTWSDTTVHEAAEQLRRRGMARILAEPRSQKYRHLLEENHGFLPRQLSVLAVLMLRGPQTAGELRGRTERMFSFQSIPEVEAVLRELSEGDEPWVMRLPVRPGSKEPRYGHLLSGEPDLSAEAAPAPVPGAGSSSRVEALENEIQALRDELAALREEFAVFRKQFE